MSPARRFLSMNIWLLGAALIAAPGLEGCSPSVSQQRAPEEERPGPEAASDLDQPLDKLLTARCEHGVLQYTCDECRYQVGMAKVDPSLFRPSGPIDTIRAEHRSLSRGLELDGEIRPDETRSIALNARAAGIVRSISVDLGGRVRPGQVLFELDCPEFSQAKARFLRARAASRLAEATWERENELFQRSICPQKDLIEARAAREAASAEEGETRELLLGFGLSDEEVRTLGEAPGGTGPGWLPVCAPMGGTVLERNVTVGASVEPGKPLLLIGDTSRMWAIATIYERELSLVEARGAQSAAAAEIETSAYPGRIFKGRLDRLYGTLDENTRTVKARVWVDNPENLLRAGMFARVRLLLDPERQVLALPAEAVLEDAGRAFVFERTVPPYFVRRPVTTGATQDGWIEITSGLSGDEIVVSRGAFLLKSDVLRSKMGAGCAD
jgi:membrane fusion protein, heavy metal efflux system